MASLATSIMIMPLGGGSFVMKFVGGAFVTSSLGSSFITSLLWELGSEHLHGFQDQGQAVHKRPHRHTQNPGLVCRPPHREGAARQGELLADAHAPWLSVGGQRLEGDGSLLGRWERNI